MNLATHSMEHLWSFQATFLLDIQKFVEKFIVDSDEYEVEQLDSNLWHISTSNTEGLIRHNPDSVKMQLEVTEELAEVLAQTEKFSYYFKKTGEFNILDYRAALEQDNSIRKAAEQIAESLTQ
jgi:hypothetical protein